MRLSCHYTYHDSRPKINKKASLIFKISLYVDTTKLVLGMTCFK